VLNFSDVPAGTLVVFSPYQSQGFTLSATDPDNGFPQNFAFNSPDTGNGVSQTPGSNPFYANANGLSAFGPATILLTQTSGAPFSLLSIDLARNFEFDPAPRVAFTATKAGGGTVSATFQVTTPTGPPPAFQEFQFSGFTNIVSVTWSQPAFSPTGPSLH